MNVQQYSIGYIYYFPTIQGTTLQPFKTLLLASLRYFLQRYNQHTVDVISHGGFPDSTYNNTGCQLHSNFR